jgi:hypothetical protein
MLRRTRIPLIGTALMLSVALAAGLPAARNLGARPAVAAPVAQAVHNCPNFQLLPGIQGSQGAAGTIVMIYRLHNLFSGACTLYGYPGILLLDKNFGSEHTVVHRGLPVGHAIPKQLVTVAGHGNAYFTLLYNQVPVGSQPCETARYLMITPPNDFLPIVTHAAPGGGLIHPCTGNVYVSPVTAQPTYP